MAKGTHNSHLQIDPRTKILLLLLSNLLLFMGSTTELIFIYMAALALILLCSGCYKTVLTFAAVFLGLNYINFAAVLFFLLESEIAGKYRL